MELFRLKYEAAGYLDIEVIGVSRADVLERFANAVRGRCKRSGADWAEDAIEEVTNKASQWIEQLSPGVWIEGVQLIR